MRNRFFAMALASAIFAGCGADPEPPTSDPEPEAAASTPEPLPATIVAERGGFIPEGVEYDNTHARILTGSLSEGSIFQLHRDGRVTAVVTDPDLVSSVGIEVDEAHDRLLVANADRSVFESGGTGQAKLGVYTLSTGERIAMVDLAASIVDAPAGAMHFANDVAVGDDGTACVTDTRMNVVYRVGMDNVASVLHRFEPIEGLGLNGIIYHPSGYLLVAGGTTLWKVPVPLDDPTGVTQVTLSDEVRGQDGLVWMPDGALAIVSNADSRVAALTSADEWTTAQLTGVAPYETQATTGAIIGDDLYVVHPHFTDDEPPSVERVLFQDP